MTHPLRLRFPSHVVEIAGLPGIAERALRAVWGACVDRDRDNRGPRPSTGGTSSWEVRSVEGGHELHGAFVPPDRVTEPSHVAPLVEACLYSSFTRWHPEETFLHAATVVCGGRPVVLLGRSGSGKSSLALEAARAGWEYLTDELTMTDGRTVRGIGRTIQFDPGPVGAPLPERLRNLDLESYRVLHESGSEHVQPLYPWARLRLPAVAPRAEDALVLVLDGPSDRTALEPLPPVEALAFALGERRGENVALGALIGAGRTYRLRWHEPREALGAIARLCDAARP